MARGKTFKPAYPNGQTTIDQYIKVWVCPWCGRVWYNPSSLSQHKYACPKIPPEEREKIKKQVGQRIKERVLAGKLSDIDYLIQYPEVMKEYYLEGDPQVEKILEKRKKQLEEIKNTQKISIEEILAKVSQVDDMIATTLERINKYLDEKEAPHRQYIS
jgi:hypothetical protein